MTTAARAPRGGTTGKNGEWYTGGEFLPSTELPSRTTTQRKGTGKREIAPYVWEVAPEAGMVSLYRQIAGIFANVGRDGVMRLCPSNLPYEYCGRTVEEVDMLIEAYNDGVRWLLTRKEA